MSDPCAGCTRPQCHDDNMSDDDTNKISQYVQAHEGVRFCMVDITDCWESSACHPIVKMGSLRRYK